MLLFGYRQVRRLRGMEVVLLFQMVAVLRLSRVQLGATCT